MTTVIQADQVYSADTLTVDGENVARLRSFKGLAEVQGPEVRVAGHDVRIASTSSGVDPGRLDMSATDQARINSGKKVKLTAPVIDFVAQAVIVRGTHEDPEIADRVPGMIWFRSDLKLFRVWTGTAIKTLKFA